MMKLVQTSRGYIHLSSGNYTGSENVVASRVPSKHTKTVFDTTGLFPRIEIPHWTGPSTTRVNIGDLNVN